MRSDHIPMSIEEFHRLPHRLGWKHEYWDGHAHITPGHAVMDVVMPVQHRPAVLPDPPCRLRPVRPDDEAALVAAFVAGFGDSVDYCDWKPHDIHASAQRCIRDFFAGKRGEPLDAARVAVAEAGASDPMVLAQSTEIILPVELARPAELVGAALVVREGERDARLEMLFVATAWRGKGLATALAAEALAELRAAGFETLYSRYLLANAVSRAWHRRFGFTEAPDWLAAGHLAYHAQFELRRREAAGDITDAERAELSAEIEHWEARRREVDPLRGMKAEVEHRSR